MTISNFELRRVKLVLTIFLIFWGSSTLFADAVGNIVLEKGSLRIRRDKTDTIHKERGRQIPIKRGDRIQTGTNTKANLNFSVKKDKIILFSNTYFRVMEISNEESLVALPVGKARFTIKKRIRRAGKSRKRRPFRVRTANAVVGVKGTEFVVSSFAGETSLLTLEGLVTLANIETPDIEVDVPLNKASRIRQDLQPTKPVTVPEKDRKEILKTDSPKAFNNIKFGPVIKADSTTKKNSKNNKKDTNEKTPGKPGDTSLPPQILGPELDEKLPDDLNIDDLTDEIDRKIGDVEKSANETLTKEIEITITN